MSLSLGRIHDLYKYGGEVPEFRVRGLGSRIPGPRVVDLVQDYCTSWEPKSRTSWPEKLYFGALDLSVPRCTYRVQTRWTIVYPIEGPTPDLRRPHREWACRYRPRPRTDPRGQKEIHLGRYTRETHHLNPKECRVTDRRDLVCKISHSVDLRHQKNTRPKSSMCRSERTWGNQFPKDSRQFYVHLFGIRNESYSFRVSV